MVYPFQGHRGAGANHRLGLGNAGVHPEQVASSNIHLHSHHSDLELPTELQLSTTKSLDCVRKPEYPGWNPNPAGHRTHDPLTDRQQR